MDSEQKEPSKVSTDTPQLKDLLWQADPCCVMTLNVVLVVVFDVESVRVGFASDSPLVSFLGGFYESFLCRTP